MMMILKEEIGSKYPLCMSIQIENGTTLNMRDYIDPVLIPVPKNEVWRCTNCDRTYVFNEDNTVSKVYVVEQQ